MIRWGEYEPNSKFRVSKGAVLEKKFCALFFFYLFLYPFSRYSALNGSLEAITENNINYPESLDLSIHSLEKIEEVFSVFSRETFPLSMNNITKEIIIAHILKNAIPTEVPINITDGRGRTLLHYAAENYLYMVGEILIQKGIDVNRPDIDGCTALHLLVKKNLPSPDTIDKIIPSISEELEANLPGNFSMPLSQRRKYTHTHKTTSSRDLCQYAIENDVMKKNINDNLFFIEQRNSYKFYLKQNLFNRTRLGNLLLLKNANPYLLDKEGRSPLDYAKENGIQELIRSILSLDRDKITDELIDDFNETKLRTSPPLFSEESPLSQCINKP